MNKEFPLCQKDIDYIMSDCLVEFLEGTTKAGKTTKTIPKLGRKIIQSDKKYHVIASKTTGDAENKIINKDYGFCDIFPSAVYHGKGTVAYKTPHIEFEGKIIFVLGFDTIEKWQKVLGMQFGCVFVDECNTANMGFMREIIMRCDYLVGSLNPDDPNKEIYKQFINRCRPYKKYEKDVPPEIMAELKEPEVEGWKYWFFSFEDNLSLTKEDIARRKREVPPGTKEWKNKIMGLRGKASGLCYPNFGNKNIVKAEDIKKKIANGELDIAYISCGVDSAFSGRSDDLSAFIYQLITYDRKVIIVDEFTFNNRDLNDPVAVSDFVRLLVQFLDKNDKEWGFCRDVFVESADSGTNQELVKYNRLHPTPYNFIPSHKKVKVVDRVRMVLSWIHTGDYLVCDHCKQHIKEMMSYSWDEKKINVPEDRNNHTIDACSYGWIPYRSHIGTFGVEEDEEY